MRTILAIFLFGCLVGFQSRQDPMAESILQAVSKKHKKLAGFRADFTHESESNSGQTLGSSKGKILVSGNKYRLTTESQTLICDGKNVWAINPKAKEVTLSDYEPDPDDITPDRIYSFYQKGYKYLFMGEVKTKGRIWQTIDIEPENIQKEISKIRLFVDKKSLNITKWILFERGSNNREVFLIDKFEPLPKVEQSEFSFSKKQYPNLKMVDLR
ncbi:MAG TPA: outer membrane lipoprotein carrier protein LolA [Catalimonadaceae bacterium]|nr:outer membrane lipoprotein carrier protein LolA [Catalimonadaceae bacterium]